MFTSCHVHELKPRHHLRAHGHLLLNLGNGLARVQALGTGTRAVENSVAAVQAHVVLEVGLAFALALVARVGQPAVALQQDRGAQVLLRVPPVRGARG